MGDNTLNIRHYIFGSFEDPTKEREFLTTTLNIEAAEKFALDHRSLFEGRYDHYEIRLGASEVIVTV